MFEPIPTPELVHGLGRFRVAALDLPGIQLAAQEHNAANAVLINVSDATEKSYLEVYMRGVNSHLGVTHIAALDLAAINVLGSPNYRREIQGSGTQFSYTRSDGTVVIVDSSGRLVLDIDPRVFCRIISAPRLASLAPGIVAVATKVNDSTKIVKTEVAVRGEFEVFHNLATELQAKVWEFASRNYEGRTIAVTEVRYSPAYIFWLDTFQLGQCFGCSQLLSGASFSHCHPLTPPRCLPLTQTS
jgi:hypothetical protein